MIRNAHPKDSEEIAKLIYLVWKDMELDLVQSLSKSKAIEIIEKSIKEIEYRNYFKHILIFEEDKEIAGCIVSYDGNKELYYENNWNNLIVKDELKKFGTPLPVKEAKNNEKYIDTVATFPKHRGKGIATKLFKALIEKEPKANWSLNCDKNNLKAHELYLKLGFKNTGELKLYNHIYHHMTYQK